MNASTYVSNIRIAAAIALATVLLAGCPAQPMRQMPDAMRACVPGATQVCVCTTGQMGAQSCNESGSGFAACECRSTDRDAGCPGGSECGGQCVTLASDAANCGACGVHCGPDQVCANGQCQSACGVGLAECAGTCRDLQHDSANCGVCGRACAASEACVGGNCSTECPTNRLSCAGQCVDPATDVANCGACGTRCDAGQTCVHSTCVSPGEIQVAWDFPGLWIGPQSETWFPTYVAHLFGSSPPVMHPLPMTTACATITNTTSSATQVDLTVRLPGYADDGHQRVLVGAGATQQSCLDPGFALDRLYALRAFTPGSVEATAQTADGTVVGRATRAMEILPGNGIGWHQPSVGRSDMVDLAPVYVMPNDPDVLSLRAAAEARSYFNGSFGDQPYERSLVRRVRSLAASTRDVEALFLEPGETMQFGINFLSTGSAPAVDVYIFTVDQYTAWAQGTGTTATAAWVGVTAGTAGDFSSPDGSWYVIAVVNTQANAPVDVTWTRSNTREDVAYDALAAAYEELRARGMTYVNISTSYFEGIQYIRRPGETIAMRAGNCIDGSLLFASVLENIGMEPVLLVTSNHAYMGVRSAPGSQFVWPIETTMVGTNPSSDAFFYSLDHFASDLGMGAVQVEDVTTARRRGIRPLPL